MSNTYRERLMKIRELNKEKIKDQVSILDLASEYFTVEKHGSLFKLKEHDSCVLYPDTNTWHRFAYNKSGDVFSFLEEFDECGKLPFNKAYSLLLNRIDPSMQPNPKETKKRAEQLNEIAYKQKCSQSLLKNLNIDTENRHIKAYLIQERKIDPDLVFEMIDKHYIYQVNNQLGSKNVAFCGYNDYGMLASVCIRSCNSKSNFKGDFPNCDYNYCWFYAPGTKPDDFCPKIDSNKPLICCESYIDMLSYITLLKLKGVDKNKYNFLSCGSVEKSKAVLSYQERYQIKDIILSFDNDKPGIIAMKDLESKLLNRMCKVKVHLPNENDWNDELKAITLKKNLTHRVHSAKSQSTLNPQTTQKNKKLDTKHQAV